MSALRIISISMTIARFVMAFIAAAFIIREEQNVVVVLLIALIILFDIADGAVYRKSGKPETKSRRMLDSIIDKLSMFLVALAVALKAHPHIIIVACIMELWIAGISITAYRHGALIKPSLLGKIGCVLFAGVCLTTLYCYQAIALLTLVVFLIVSFLAIADYHKQLSILQKERP